MGYENLSRKKAAKNRTREWVIPTSIFTIILIVPNNDYFIIQNEVFDTDFVDVRYKSDIGQNWSKQNKS